jgi:hypothetical protein
MSGAIDVAEYLDLHRLILAQSMEPVPVRSEVCEDGGHVDKRRLFVASTCAMRRCGLVYADIEKGFLFSHLVI